MKKMRIKLLRSFIISCFFACVVTYVNSWSQAAAAPPLGAINNDIKTEAKDNPSPATDNDQVKPIGNFITTLIGNDLAKTPDNNLGSATEGAAFGHATASKVTGDISGLLGNNKKSMSLMYDDEELANIQNAVDSFKNDRLYIPAGGEAPKDDKKPEKEGQDNIQSYIYLGSIMYFGPKNWIVWINNKKITYEDNKASNELYLISVTRSDVDILWTISISKWKILSGKKSEALAPKINNKNQVEISFKLKPNQTYVLRSDKVVEGVQMPFTGGSEVSATPTPTH